jgi:cobalt-zinc-cadmium efflux system outer membrane protein
MAIGMAFPLIVNAQVSDTIQLTIEDARSRLLAHNLSLLAEQFNVSDAEADAVQARVWNNPNFVWNSDMYSIEKNEYLNYKNQVLVQLEMMVPFTGRISKATRVADLNVEEQKLNLENTIRDLLFAFATQYNGLAIAQERAKYFREVAQAYDRLIEAAEMNEAVGNFSGSEVVRLKSERMSIQAHMLEIDRGILEGMAHMRTMLYYRENVHLDLRIKDDTLRELKGLDVLLAELPTHRPDYKAALLRVDISEADLRLQRALVMPDVKMGYQPLDRGSNYVRPYQGIVVEVPLVLFDRNQGPVKRARNAIDRSRLEVLNKENEIRNELFSTYQGLLNAQTMLAAYTPEFLASVEKVKTEATLNYNSRNLSILEYIDLQRIYVQTMEDYLTVKGFYLDSKEGLNYVTGQTLFK